MGWNARNFLKNVFTSRKFTSFQIWIIFHLEDQNAWFSNIYRLSISKTMFSNIIQWIMSVLMYSTQNSSHKITDLPNFLVLKKKSLRADKNLQRNSTTMWTWLFLATNAQRKTKQNCDNMTHFWTLNLYQADVQIFAACFYSFFQALAYVCLSLSWNWPLVQLVWANLNFALVVLIDFAFFLLHVFAFLARFNF